MDRGQAQTQPFPQRQGKGPRGQFTQTRARGPALFPGPAGVRSLETGTRSFSWARAPLRGQVFRGGTA